MRINIAWIVFVSMIAVTIAAITMPSAAYYNWYGYPMQGEASENAQFAYNGTVSNGTVVGGVYVGCGHGLDYTPYTQSFNVPDGTVKFAHLYVHVWHGTEDYQGKLKVYYTNATGTYILFANGTDAEGNLTLGGDEDNNDNVWTSTHGVSWVWYDVKDYVTPGENSATAYTYKISSGFDGRVGAIELVVVYENASMNETRYWVVQGHDALAYETSGYPAKDYGYAYFNGTINPDEWDTGMLYTTWIAGDQGDNDSLWFNGHLLCEGCTNYGQGSYLDTRWFVVKNDTINYLNPTDNYAKYWRDGDAYVHWMNAILVLTKTSPAPDLVVSEIESPMLASHEYTLGVVANHTYKVNATIKNQGADIASASHATLSVNGNVVDTQPVPSLAPGNCSEVSFTWTPSAPGTYTLRVTADALGEVNESNEANNASTKEVEVLPEGQPDLEMAPDYLNFKPSYAWHAANNKTRIEVKVMNNGTGDASNFDVRLFVDGEQKGNVVMSVDAKAGKLTYFEYDAPKGGPYQVKIVLDADGEVSESDESNNETTKPLKVIEIKIWNSHHYGNTSTYNGKESNYQDVEMFKVVKLVPENTTAWDALNSVANVTPHFAHPEQTYVFGIDGLLEDPKGPIYWYLYHNGRYVPNNVYCGDIRLRDGETLHWDFQKHIYGATESFTPPCTVQSYVAGDDLFPEPFTHGFPMNLPEDGYSRTVWNTSIVYPAESPEYASIAEKIRDKLIAGGVPSDRISIVSDSNITNEQKKNNNLILIGNYTANDIIVEINQYHEYFGMPVFFNYTNCTIIDDYTDEHYDHGEVVEMFDNPYDNGPLGSNYSWNDPGPVILMASGLNDGDAKDAASLLINYTINNENELNKSFWRIRLIMCGDVDCDGKVLVNTDAMKVFRHAIHNEPVCSEWAADVDCDGKVLVNTDAMKVFRHAIHNEPLDCCTGCM